MKHLIHQDAILYVDMYYVCMCVDNTTCYDMYDDYNNIIHMLRFIRTII